MYVVISVINGAVNVTDNLEGFMVGDDVAVMELLDGASTLAARYGLINGEVVDLYPTLTADDEVFAAIAAKNASEVVVSTPVENTKLTKLAFMDRFTLDEMAAIYSAAKQNVVVEIFLDKLKMAESIDIKDANTIAGVNALVSGGLLTADRATAILQ